MRLLFLLLLAIVGSLIGILSFGSSLVTVASLCWGKFQLALTFGLVTLVAIAAEGVLAILMAVCAPKKD